MFRDDARLAAKAARVSALAKDVSEYLAGLALPPPQRWTAGHLPPHRRLSLGLLAAARPEDHRGAEAAAARRGFAVKEAAEAHICCGSAGTYNILQPKIAGELRARKVRQIGRTKPDIVATAISAA